MPLGSSYNQQTIRLLEYGPARSRKTWWALIAAEAGFNVLVLDGENKCSTVNHLSMEAQARCRIINCKDKIDRPVFAPLIEALIKGMPITWNDDECYIATQVTGLNVAHNHFSINLTSLGMNDILVIDSWYPLVYSTAWCWMRDNGIDIDNYKRTDLGFDHFQQMHYKLDRFLNALTSLRCHLIVIAHQQVTEMTRAKPTDKKTRAGEQYTVIDHIPIGEQRIMPISSSKPHSMKLASHFTDIAYFTMVLQQVMLDMSASPDRDGGSNSLNGQFLWEQLRFDHLTGAMGYPNPVAGLEMPGCVWYPADAGAVQPDVTASPTPSAEPTTLQAAHAGGGPINVAALTGGKLAAVE